MIENGFTKPFNGRRYSIYESNGCKNYIGGEVEGGKKKAL